MGRKITAKEIITIEHEPFYHSFFTSGLGTKVTLRTPLREDQRGWEQFIGSAVHNQGLGQWPSVYIDFKHNLCVSDVVGHAGGRKTVKEMERKLRRELRKHSEAVDRFIKEHKDIFRAIIRLQERKGFIHRIFHLLRTPCNLP